MFQKDSLFNKKDDASGRREGKQPTYGSTTALPGVPPTSPSPPTRAEDAVVTSGRASTNEELKGSRLIVGPDIKLKGAEITDCDTLIVEGRVEASMDSRVVQIAERGSYVGTVGIDVAEIRGIFEGELTARKQLIIHNTGKVSGKIRYGKIVIQEGGEIGGDVAMLAGSAALKAVPPSGSNESSPPAEVKVVETSSAAMDEAQRQKLQQPKSQGSF
jgi:cytoskeletal protein CcmA (bactofilin family)